MMKSKVLQSLLFGSLVSVVCAESSAAQTQKAIISEQAEKYSSPPYAWYNENKQQREGLVRYLQERLFREVDIQLERIPFDIHDAEQRHQVYSRLALGEIDFMGYTARTPRIVKMAHYVDEPLFEVVIKVYSRADQEVEYKGWHSLKGKKGLIRGRDGERFFSIHPQLADYAEDNFDLKSVSSREQAMQMLLNGKADYWVDSDSIAISFIKAQGLEGQIVASDIPLAEVPFYMAVSKQSPHQLLVKDLAEKLRELRESGEYQQIERRYTQRYLDYYHSTAVH